MGPGRHHGGFIIAGRGYSPEVIGVAARTSAQATLLRAINAVAIGIPYTEKALREQLETAIRPLYDARGRIRG